MRFTAQAEEADIDVVQRSLTRAGAEEVGSFFKSVAAVTRAEHQLVSEHRAAVDHAEALIAQARPRYGRDTVEMARRQLAARHSPPYVPGEGAPSGRDRRRGLQSRRVRRVARAAPRGETKAPRARAGASPPINRSHPPRARTRAGSARVASLHVARYAVRDPGPTRSCCCGVQTRLDALKAQLSNEEALSARIKQLPIY